MHEEASQESVTPLHDLSAVDLIAGYRGGQFSPSDVLEDLLAHIALWEPRINALYAFDPDGARATAKASTERWQGGQPAGPLDGVPVTIKDNIATRGDPKPVGTAAEDMTPQKADAPPAQRLREAGAILFTKTTMPDYGMLSSGLSSFHPLTRNPWKLDRNPGGSSAGAGAAAVGRSLWGVTPKSPRPARVTAGSNTRRTKLLARRAPPGGPVKSQACVIREAFVAVAAAGFAAMLPISAAFVGTSMETFNRLMIFQNWI